MYSTVGTHPTIDCPIPVHAKKPHRPVHATLCQLTGKSLTGAVKPTDASCGPTVPSPRPPGWRRGGGHIRHDAPAPGLRDGTDGQAEVRPRRLRRLAAEGAEGREERLHGGSTLPRRQGLVRGAVVAASCRGKIDFGAVGHAGPIVSARQAISSIGRLAAVCDNIMCPACTPCTGRLCTRVRALREPPPPCHRSAAQRCKLPARLSDIINTAVCRRC
eukprot:COSAG01_NODE_724_length_14056_cov_41.795443_21_plen_217_part_00